MPIAIKTKFELNITAAAQVNGDCLGFSGTLVRAEVNANHDEITGLAVQELASTLAGKALTEEHENKPVGYFTSARVVNDSVECEAVLWARRFPEIAADVMNGKRGLSVEATAAEGSCSLCGATFTADADACDHVVNRFNGSGATRQMRGMICRGGGVVLNPAGTQTVIDPESVKMVASQYGAEFQKALESPVIPQERSATYTPETFVWADEKENGGAGLNPVEAIDKVLEDAGVAAEESKTEEETAVVAEVVTEESVDEEAKKKGFVPFKKGGKEGSAEEEAGESDEEEKKEDMKAKASIIDAAMVTALRDARARIVELEAEREQVKVAASSEVALEAKLVDRIIALGEVIGFDEAKDAKNTLRTMDDGGFELLVKAASKNAGSSLKLPKLPVEGAKTDAEVLETLVQADKKDEDRKSYDIKFVFGRESAKSGS